MARRGGRRVVSVMEGGQEVLKRESMGRRFKGELKDLVERIHSTEVGYVLYIVSLPHEQNQEACRSLAETVYNTAIP